MNGELAGLLDQLAPCLPRAFRIRQEILCVTAQGLSVSGPLRGTERNNDALHQPLFLPHSLLLELALPISTLEALVLTPRAEESKGEPY